FSRRSEVLEGTPPFVRRRVPLHERPALAPPRPEAYDHSPETIALVDRDEMPLDREGRAGHGSRRRRRHCRQAQLADLLDEVLGYDAGHLAADLDLLLAGRRLPDHELEACADPAVESNVAGGHAEVVHHDELRLGQPDRSRAHVLHARSRARRDARGRETYDHHSPCHDSHWSSNPFLDART